MEPHQAVILGIIQGLTEFLPISSSGHLVISQQFFGLKESELYFDISVHIGTLVAVVIFFWKDLCAMVVSLIRYAGSFFSKDKIAKDAAEDLHIRLVVLIIVGSLPTAVIGLFLHKWSDQIFSSILITGSMLVVTGILLFATGLLLWSTRRIEKPAKSIAAFTKKDALLIGVIQGLAIIPGISRSGSTIAVGLFLGLEREIAARYSFLLSIPAILGAAFLIFKDIPEGAHFPFTAALSGGVTSCIVGYAALRFLVALVKRGNLHMFAPYCWIAGLLVLFWGL